MSAPSRLLIASVGTAAKVSGGAILAMRAPQTCVQAVPEIVGALVRMAAEAVASGKEPGSIGDAEVFLAALCERAGTLRGAVELAGAGRHCSPALSRERARALSAVLWASDPVSLESALRKAPELAAHLATWVAAQGTNLQARLDAYEAWMNSPIVLEHLAGTFAAPMPQACDPPSAEAAAGPEDLGRLEIALLRDKALLETLGPGQDRRLPPGLRDAAEALAGAGDARARVVGLIALRRFEIVDQMLPSLRQTLDACAFWSLWGDRYWFEGRAGEAVSAYRSARSSSDTAWVRCDLAMALVRAGRPSPEDASREAIELLAEGIGRAGGDGPGLMRLEALLGGLWLHHSGGDRDANVRRGIEHLERAVGMVDQGSEPDWWAHVHMDLGAAWLSLPSGRKVENVQRAMTCFDRASLAWRRESDPERWATTQNWMAQAWDRLPSGDRAANLGRAVEHLQAALQVRSRRDNPVGWAMLQNNLGNIYVQWQGSDHAGNIRRAIECHQAALEVWSDLERRGDWAATQNNLGNAWAVLPAAAEEREKNLRRAVASYKSALEVRTRANAPVEWAATQNNMGSALMHLTGGAGALGAGPNAQAEAIACFERALEVRTREAFPLDWAKTQSNLGQAWARRPNPGRAEHLRRAIECYERALTVLGAASHPHLHEHVTARKSEAQDALDEILLLGERG